VGYHSQSTWSELGYRQTVQGIAQDAIEEYPFTNELHSDDRQEYVSESVDGNEYVIYYGANEIALRASDNEPDGDEVSAMSASDADWRTMRALTTYMAMEADVMEEINRIFWAPFADGAEERYRLYKEHEPVTKSRNTKLEGETLIKYLMQRFNYTEVEARQKAQR
tara:strand:+ start:331 stop:828 length:498 start_codon:yes stop_codon:yes gene_type:complete